MANYGGYNNKGYLYHIKKDLENSSSNWSLVKEKNCALHKDKLLNRCFVKTRQICIICLHNFSKVKVGRKVWQNSFIHFEGIQQNSEFATVQGTNCKKIYHSKNSLVLLSHFIAN